MPETRDNWLSEEFEPGLISVVIPTYNRAQLVCETVESVFRQTYRPIEIIVGDDGSSDATIARLDDMKARSPDGVTLQHFAGEHKGACPVRNHGAAISRGEYLMFLDSDDLLTEPAFEQLVNGATKSGADLIWGPWRDMKTGPDACTLANPEPRRFRDDWLVSLLDGQWIATCGVIYRRSCLNRISGWREQVVLDGDFDFNARLGAAGATLAGTEGVVSYYRRHGDTQMSEGNYLTVCEAKAGVLRNLEAQLDASGGWTPERRRALAGHWFWTARMIWYRHQDVGTFERYVNEAHRVDPDFSPPKSWYRWVARLTGYPTAERVAAIGRSLFR